MEKMVFSIIVATYNSDWDKTRETLYSIIVQKNVKFEIIVVDDGSIENNFDRIKKYFIEKNFKDYVLISHECNQGILLNVLSGVEIAKGDLIKLISPGDFLYNDKVLADIYNYSKKVDSSVYFTNNYYYYVNQNKEIVVNENRKNPIDLRPYLKHNKRKIRFNYIVKRDYILGAGVFEKRNELLDALRKLQSYVKYAEDTSIIYLIAKGDNVSYVDMGGVWYEDGTGISTSSNKSFLEMLAQDDFNTFKYLYERKLINAYIYRMHCSPYRIIRNLLKGIVLPIDSIGKIIRRNNKVYGWQTNNYDMQLLRDILSN